MSEITSLLNLFKPASDLVQSIYVIVKEYDNIELKGNINNLVSKLTELQLTYTNEVDEKLKLREEVKKMKEKLDMTKGMHRQFPGGPYFHLEDKQPYCPTCWESEYKKIGLGNLNNEHGRCDLCMSVIDLVSKAEREKNEEEARNSYMDGVDMINFQNSF